MANQVLQSNLKKQPDVIVPYDGLVIRRKINNGAGTTYWKTQKEEITKYYMEIVDGDPKKEEENDKNLLGVNNFNKKPTVNTNN